MGRQFPVQGVTIIFFPLSEGKISYKRVSDDEAEAGTFTFFDNVTEEQVSDVKTMEFIACQYDSFWWVGLVEEINKIDTPKTAIGRMYQISDSDYEKILNLELEIGTH